MLEDKQEPGHETSSSGGLLADGSASNGKSHFLSTQREDFKWPQPNKGPVARRRLLMQRLLFNEMNENYAKRIAGKDEVKKMENFSEYSRTFKGDGFDVRDILDSADPEKMARYPLYTDQACSIYFNNIKKIKQKTVSNDPKACFRKYSYFSKPFYAELED